MWIIIAILFIFIAGVLDDHKDLSPKTKFFVISISTIFLSFNNILISDLGTFFTYNISLGSFALPFTIFAVVGFTNALNLIDGLDGLAATISIVIFSAFFIIGYNNSDVFMTLISAAFISALLAFLLFNWYPASIFMGDSGSLTIGFTISMLAIKSLNYVSPVSILFITAIPIIDTIIVIFRRSLARRSIFTADSCHIHHILKSFFNENTKITVIFLAFLQIIYSTIGLLLNNYINDAYIFLFFFINLTILYFILGSIIRKQKRDC
jgi:UDP-GlcNAc:undecaprenyl-phosphate GlcNAc-1-phosphate transferase